MVSLCYTPFALSKTDTTSLAHFWTPGLLLYFVGVGGVVSGMRWGKLSNCLELARQLVGWENQEWVPVEDINIPHVGVGGAPAPGGATTSSRSTGRMLLLGDENNPVGFASLPQAFAPTPPTLFQSCNTELADLPMLSLPETYVVVAGPFWVAFFEKIYRGRKHYEEIEQQGYVDSTAPTNEDQGSSLVGAVE